jgi:hypothetical protein
VAVLGTPIREVVARLIGTSLLLTIGAITSVFGLLFPDFIKPIKKAENDSIIFQRLSS